MATQRERGFRLRLIPAPPFAIPQSLECLTVLGFHCAANQFIVIYRGYWVRVRLCRAAGIWRFPVRFAAPEHAVVQRLQLSLPFLDGTGGAFDVLASYGEVPARVVHLDMAVFPAARRQFA